MGVVIELERMELLVNNVGAVACAIKLPSSSFPSYRNQSHRGSDVGLDGDSKQSSIWNSLCTQLSGEIECVSSPATPTK